MVRSCSTFDDRCSSNAPCDLVRGCGFDDDWRFGGSSSGPTNALSEAEAIGLERVAGNGESEILEDNPKSDDVIICAGGGAELSISDLD